MAKRVATSDLNHDNWDKEDKREEAGTFRKADDCTIQSRVIRQAKRRSASSPYGSADSSLKTGETKSVFANFSGFKVPANATGISFNFGSGSTLSSDGSAPLKESSSTSVQQKNGIVKENFNDMSAKKDEDTNDMGRYTKQSKEFYADLKALNESVSKWIQKHVENNSCCILTPVFKDYESHLSKLEDKYVSAKNVDKTLSSKETWSLPLGAYASKNVAQDAFPFSFGLPGSSENFCPRGYFSTPPVTKKQENKNVEEISKTAVSTVMSPFNQSLVSPTQPSTLSSTEEKNKPPPPQFSFGSQKPFTFANVSKPDGGSGDREKDDTGDSEEPPKAEFTPVVEKDAVYSQRCKVFVKKGSSYQDRGVGTLFLKPVSSGTKTQLLVRADTSLGNVLLNTLLFQSMPLQRMGTNNVMLVCIPTPEAEPPPTPVLLRVKTSEDADKLLEKLKEHIK